MFIFIIFHRYGTFTCVVKRTFKLADNGTRYYNLIVGTEAGFETNV